jgi:hypothetical protein
LADLTAVVNPERRGNSSRDEGRDRATDDGRHDDDHISKVTNDAVTHGTTSSSIRSP